MSRLYPLVVVALVIVGCGDGGGTTPEVLEARIGEPTGANGALYLTARGYGTPDRLIAASTGVADVAQLHETVIGSDGTATMRALTAMELPGRGDLVLEPGGRHVMLIGVDRLEVGTTVEVTLVWENAGEMTVEAVVVEPFETMGEHDRG